MELENEAKALNDKIIEQMEEIKNYQGLYQDLQFLSPYFSTGIDQLEWVSDVLHSPCGTDLEIQEKIDSAVNPWTSLPSVPSGLTFGVSGMHGLGTSACAQTVTQIDSWATRNISEKNSASELKRNYQFITENEQRREIISRALKNLNADTAEKFESSVKLYHAWKANPSDLVALATTMRNVLESFKGLLNIVYQKEKGGQPSKNFSWDKMIDCIGSGNKKELLIQKTNHTSLHSTLSEYLKEIVRPSSEEMESCFASFIDNVDSTIHLLNPSIKEKYFGIEL